MVPELLTQIVPKPYRCGSCYMWKWVRTVIPWNWNLELPNMSLCYTKNTENTAAWGWRGEKTERQTWRRREKATTQGEKEKNLWGEKKEKENIRGKGATEWGREGAMCKRLTGQKQSNKEVQSSAHRQLCGTTLGLIGTCTRGKEAANRERCWLDTFFCQRKMQDPFQTWPTQIRTPTHTHTEKELARHLEECH